MGVNVDPGDIEDFGRLAKSRADDWESVQRAPYRLTTGDADSYDYPYLGAFEEANTLIKTYGGESGKLQEVVTAFNSLHELLESLGDASKEIAKNYRSVEALNGASVDQINRILGEEFDDSPAPGDTGQPPAQS